MSPPPLLPCVGGLVHDAAGRILLVRRANEPGRGLWSLPGGRVEPSEDDGSALVRELAEETGLVVRPGALVGRVVRGPYAISDYRCSVVGGELRAGDDASEVRWCDGAALAGLPLVDGLLEVLTEWDALPRRSSLARGPSRGPRPDRPEGGVRGA